MKRIGTMVVVALIAAGFASGLTLLPSAAAAAGPIVTGKAAVSTPPPPGIGPAGVAMQARAASPPSALHRSARANAPSNASYTAPTPNSGNDLPPGTGPVMPKTTIYYDFWLPTGQHYGADATADTTYENLLIRFAQDLGGSQFHNLVNQYYGTSPASPGITNTVTYGGDWVNTANYTHAGTTVAPLTDADIQAEVTHAVATNNWAEDTNHIVAVFTATGIHECMAGGTSCTYSATGGFCAYHNHYTDGANDSLYAFMGFDNFTHVAGQTCVAGNTSGDTDPNRSNYPNNSVSADAEVNTFSHELIESETDPHPNATWTGALSEIGDACNFTFTPRSDTGADVYLNGHPYILQEEWSNASHTCAMDLPTNGFCPNSVSQVCRPTTTITKSVDNPNPSIQSTINYTISLDNTSDTAAETNLTVTDTVPSGYAVTGVSAPSSTTPSFTAAGVTVTYDTLAVHQTRTITVTATVPSTAGATSTNCGGLAGSDVLGTSLPAQTSSPCASTTVTKGASTTALISSPNPSFFAQSVTFTATVSPVAPATGTPGGSVEFFDGTTSLGSVTLSGGQASLTTASLAVGDHSITAVYSGDGRLLGSTSSAVTQNATKQPTTTTVTCLPASAQVNQAVTCTATVSQTLANPVAPTGTVSFYIDGSPTPAATVALGTGGQASFMTTFGGGSHTVLAVYSGDTDYLTSSGTAPVTVLCTVTITGTHTAITVTSGTTCLLNAHITGGISVAKGAVLDIENSTVSGSISANAPATFRMCGSQTSSVGVAKSTGFVLIGDPANNCPANTVNGSILAASNTGGLVIVGNTVRSGVTSVYNSGAGPLPGETTPVVSGNHP